MGAAGGQAAVSDARRRKRTGSLGFYARYTLRHHLPAAICDGALFALLLGLGDVVLVKGLGGSDAQVTLLAILFPLALVLAPLVSGLMVGRAKRPFFLAAGWLGRAPLLLMPWVREPWAFLVLLGLSAASYSVTLPARNTILQANYPAHVRGRIYGLVAAAASLAGVLTALAAGAWLERHPDHFGWVYVCGAAIGILSTHLMARIRIRRQRSRWGMRSGVRSIGAAWAEVRESVRASVGILRDEPRFRRFEIAFFLYGLAFMLLQPVIPVFLVRHLGAGYLEASIAKQGAFGLANMACLPLWGRLVDRLGPVRVGVRAFGVLALSPLVLAASFSMAPAYLSFVIRGAGLAGVNVLWNLAS
ncbi:MAG: MFS transporter, partial [Planctomycetota bacterium]